MRKVIPSLPGFDVSLNCRRFRLASLSVVCIAAPVKDENRRKAFLAWTITEGELETREELLNDFASSIVSYYFDKEEDVKSRGTCKVSKTSVTILLNDGSQALFSYNRNANSPTGTSEAGSCIGI